MDVNAVPDPPVLDVAASATPEHVTADVSGPTVSDIGDLSRQVAALVQSLSPRVSQPWRYSWIYPIASASGVVSPSSPPVPLGAIQRVGSITVDATVAGTAEVFAGPLTLNYLIAAFPVPVGGVVVPFPELLLGPTEFLTVRVTGAVGSAIRIGAAGSQKWSG